MVYFHGYDGIDELDDISVMSDSGLSQSPINMDLQQVRISSDRWDEEAGILLECANLTSDDSKRIEQEIKESPFANTIYDLLSELYNERESNTTDLMETVIDGTGISANMQKLDEILEHERINSTDNDLPVLQMDDEEVNSTTLHAYKAKLTQIKQLYTSQHDKLNDLCEEYDKGMMKVFREQPQCIPISQDKVDAIIKSSRERSQFIYLELKTNVAEAVINVRKGMLENRVSKRRKRNFSKQATEILNEYFYSHIDSPYPNEEIKSELALQCNINLGQVNNWFGNKRIRYKRNIGKENNEDNGNKFSQSNDQIIGTVEDASSSEDELDYIDLPNGIDAHSP